MEYSREIWIEKDEAEWATDILTTEPHSKAGCLPEDETISYTAVFPDGAEMDVKICGVQYIEGESNLPWTEAVLFKGGCEVACSEPSDEFFGEWSLEYNGNVYTTIIKEKELELEKE